MNKRIVAAHDEVRDDTRWLALEDLADVEVTSEDPDFPVEGAFAHAESAGWRAATPGPQTIRLIFHQPIQLRQIGLQFQENTQPRTQEFVLRWRSTGAAADIVRQQFTFAPPGTRSETEHYTVQLDEVAELELSIVPDISGGDARASLRQLRLA